MKTVNLNVRGAAASCVHQVVDKGNSLNEILPHFQERFPQVKDKALLQELCYGTLRWLPKLDYCCARLLSKPLKGKQRPYMFLLYVGCYQLLLTRIPVHAAISETVEAVSQMGAVGLKGLINGVLRNFDRQHSSLIEAAEQVDSCRFAHPNWLIKQIQSHYPEQWQVILEANQQQAPLWLRVNTCKISADAYLNELEKMGILAQLSPKLDAAICLDKATNVERLPQFAAGYCSVQDGAAQFAAILLGAQADERILDACAAPGGKACHILERQPHLQALVAVDSDALRLQRIVENLTRLELEAQLICEDVSQVSRWWDGQLFDRILLDAPCSATGVIRRHPDIKWLRRAEDIDALVALQRQILRVLWKILKPGGTFLYATCSVLPSENIQQMQAFLIEHADAQLDPIHSTEHPQQPGWQLLPGEQGMDGFYYCRLRKMDTSEELH